MFEEAASSRNDVIAETHGFSDPDATPTPWSAGLEQGRPDDGAAMGNPGPTGDAGWPPYCETTSHPPESQCSRPEVTMSAYTT